MSTCACDPWHSILCEPHWCVSPPHTPILNCLYAFYSLCYVIVSLYPCITPLSLETCQNENGSSICYVKIHYPYISGFSDDWFCLKICLSNNEFTDLILCTVAHRPGINRISSQSCNHMLH